MKKYLINKKKTITLFQASLLLIFFSLLSSCATITGGSYYNATALVPDHPSATVTHNSMQATHGQALVRIMRRNADKVSFVVEEKGCKPQTFSFHQRKFRSAAAIGNLGFIFYMPITVLCDALTGSWYKPDVTETNVSIKDTKSYIYTLDYSSCKRKDETTPVKVEQVTTLVQDETVLIRSDIDLNIPKTSISNSSAIAVVIGNSNYSNTKNVDFAVHDAKTMKKYLINTLGYKEGNIMYVENATSSKLEVIFGNERGPDGKLKDWIKPGISDVFIYYSGHGAPGLKDKKGYFVPVDGNPRYIENSCYPADVFYSNLSQLDAKSITVVIDACFSGADIFENISPIVVRASTENKINNGLVFTSSSGNQVSSWYNEKGHGMFTYFFLKAIHNKNADANNNGQLTAQEIQNYISNHSEGVPYYSKRLHGVQQTPQLKGINKEKVLIIY